MCFPGIHEGKTCWMNRMLYQSSNRRRPSQLAIKPAPRIHQAISLQLSLCAKPCSVLQGQLFIFAEFSTAVSEQQSTLILFSVHVYFTWLSLLHHDPVSTHILNRRQVQRWQGEVCRGGCVFVGLWRRKCDLKIESREKSRSKFLKRIV